MNLLLESGVRSLNNALPTICLAQGASKSVFLLICVHLHFIFAQREELLFERLKISPSCRAQRELLSSGEMIFPTCRADAVVNGLGDSSLSHPARHAVVHGLGDYGSL